MNNEELTPWQRYKQKLGDTRPWDVLNPSAEWTDKETSDERFNICKSCPELIKLTSQCRQCGCFMAVKTKFKLAACPIGKW